MRLLPKTELLNGEIFYSLAEARIVVESWRRHYNAKRPTRHWATSLQRLKCSSRVRRAGGCAIPASCAARASTQPHLELTFASDQSMGAGH